MYLGIYLGSNIDHQGKIHNYLTKQVILFIYSFVREKYFFFSNEDGKICQRKWANDYQGGILMIKKKEFKIGIKMK